MKVTNQSFRCDLCGKYRSQGVTEDPVPARDELGVDRSHVCLWCIVDAEALLAKSMLGDETPTDLQVHAAELLAKGDTEG